MPLDPVSRRFLTSHADGRPDHGPVILMYHGTPRERPASKFSTTAARFTAQLDLLKDFGWKTVNVSDLDDRAKLPSRTVLLTFDDGYADNFGGAFEPLAARDMTATWYMVSGAIGKTAEWVPGAGAQGAMLAAGQVRDMHAAGMEIGSHTRTHADLNKTRHDVLQDEIEGAKHDLEDLLGTPVNSFAYPYGRYNDAARDAVRDAGYRSACSTRSGWARLSDNPWELRRITVYRDDSISTFARKLVFAVNDVSWGALLRYSGQRLGDRLMRLRRD